MIAGLLGFLALCALIIFIIEMGARRPISGRNSPGAGCGFVITAAMFFGGFAHAWWSGTAGEQALLVLVILIAAFAVVWVVMFYR